MPEYSGLQLSFAIFCFSHLKVLDFGIKTVSLQSLIVMIRFSMVRTFLVTVSLFFICVWTSSCWAQGDAYEMPDFKQCFEVLRKNRIVYNHYNDSIFLIHDYHKWKEFFRRRSRVNRQIYDTDQKALNAIKDYFSHSSDSIPREAYLEFFNAFNKGYVTKEVSDPFMIFSFSDILEKGLPLMPDSLDYSNMIHLWRLASYLQIWNLGGNEEYLKKAYNHGLQLMSEEAKSRPYYEYVYPRALQLMPRTIWILHKLQTVGEYKQYCRRLDEYLQRPDLEKVLEAEKLADLKRIQWQEEEALVRNVYMSDSLLMIQNGDRGIIERVIQRNLATDSLSDVSFVRTLFMQGRVGQITANEAWDKWMVRYKTIRKRLMDKHLNTSELVAFLQPLYTVSYINHLTDFSEEQKRKNVVMMCEDLELAYLRHKDSQNSTDYVRDLSRLSTDSWLVRYLTPEERVRFLNSLTVATHLSTYAHSLHVSKISEALMQAVLKYKPELLVGVLGYYQVEDILADKEVFLSYIHDASLYLDLGKNSILSVVNNEYRPLGEEENKIIRLHPSLALRYLKLSPELAKFHDTTLGHHKWYNGQGGYPANFDNTQSAMRIMIDIVHLSDCIQIAIEKAGRTHQEENTYDAVMKEIKAGAGTKYNPDLVALVCERADLAKKLERLVDEGWVETCYGIYKQYLKK